MQMNIELEIKEFVHYGGDCNKTMPQQLGDIQRNHRIDGTVTTHLFTGCNAKSDADPVGLAWIGCLSAPCSAVNSIKSSWGTFAHELGHNFNGGHSYEEGKGTTGGILDYGTNTHDGYVQFNTDYRQCAMCQELTMARNNMVTGFAPADPATVVPAMKDLPDYQDLPRGCKCRPEADTTQGAWSPNTTTCAQGAQMNWCVHYAWFAHECQTSCAKGVKFSCFKDPENPGHKLAWWELKDPVVVANPIWYTTTSGCPTHTAYQAEGRLETEKLPFRCCKADGSVELKADGSKLKGHEYGLCDRGTEGEKLTWAQATNVCELVGYQLCPADRLEAGVACFTGCRADKARVWSSTAWDQ